MTLNEAITVAVVVTFQHREFPFSYLTVQVASITVYTCVTALLEYFTRRKYLKWPLIPVLSAYSALVW